MPIHDNTHPGLPPQPPTPDQIRELRSRAKLSQTEAASLVHTGLRQWQRWESHSGSSATMPAATWELFAAKVMRGGVKIPQYLAGYMNRNWAVECVISWNERVNHDQG